MALSFLACRILDSSNAACQRRVALPVRTSSRYCVGPRVSDEMRPNTTKTVTHTATIAMGKMKNCRTRKGVVWRGSGSPASPPGALSSGVTSLTRGQYTAQDRLDINDGKLEYI